LSYNGKNYKKKLGINSNKERRTIDRVKNSEKDAKLVKMEREYTRDSRSS